MKVTDIIHKISNIVCRMPDTLFPTSVTTAWNVGEINALCSLLYEYAGVGTGANYTIDVSLHVCIIREITIGSHTIYHDKALDQAEIDAALEEYEYLEI